MSRLPDTSGDTYRIRPRAPHLTLPREYSRVLLSGPSSVLGVHLVGRQAAGTVATLLSLTSATSWSGIQIISSTLDQTLRVLVAGGSLVYPGRNPFSKDQWVRLVVNLEGNRLTFFADCDQAAELLLGGSETVDLQVPRDVVITLGSTAGKKESKFSVSFLLLDSAFAHCESHCDDGFSVRCRDT